MATNKHAIIRYKKLDECFSNSYRHFTINDLIEEVSQVLTEYNDEETTVSLRQIRYDISFMRSFDGYDAPIVTKRSDFGTYYQYDDLSFSIYNRPINSEEMDQIINAVEVFGRVKGLSGFEWMEELATKLKASIGKDAQKDTLISFEGNPDLVGISFLQPLYNYAKNKTVLKITYQSFNMDKPIELIIHPYHLKQFNSRWFLFGLNDEYQSIQNLPLDRIKDFTPHNIDFIENEIDFEEYFDEIVGVTNLNELEEEKVILEFSPNRLPYVISKPIHWSQKLIEGKIHLKLKYNKELRSLLLSYGSDLKVIAPESLKAKMREEVERMVENI